MKFKDDVVIGLEIHIELSTKTKLFCSCPTQGNDSPNTRVCPVCLGHPGTKPVVNKKAVEYALKLAVALGCDIADQVLFSRKSYFYPDLSKNYQITQFEKPIGSNGNLNLGDKKIGISRVHLEEDPASLVHPSGLDKSSYVLVDYNRSGNPLCEVVTEPGIGSPEEARDFMKSLTCILEYLGIFDQGKNIMKADANISIKETGYKRVEIKNISSFKEIEKALHYEIGRQKSSPEEVYSETRGWELSKGITYLLRKKESEEDYGYIIDPDLVPIRISGETITKTRKEMPELPKEKYIRYKKSLKILQEDAFIISNDYNLSKLFEEVAKHIDPVLVAKWVRREIVRVCNYNRIEMSEMNLDIKQFTVLMKLLQDKKITEKVAQKVLEIMVVNDVDIMAYIKKEGLESVSETSELQKFCNEAIEENLGAAEDYKSGKEIALNFLVGAVMKKSRGKADPVRVREILIGLI